jgi:hypothetical protein
MKRITTLLVFLFAMAVLLTTTIKVRAQEAEKSNPIDIGADLMSRYVWRGTDYGSSPSIQPYMELGLGGFALGFWGAYTTNLPGVQELDFYANYTFSDLVTIGITDYFFPDEIFGYDYYEYRADSTSHILEGMASFNGLENLPLTFMVGYNFAGDSQNSTYLELGYSFSILNIFLGAGNGFYTSDGNFNIVNVGISVSKDIKVTEKFSIPISASFITNPEAKKVHFVFGISL